MRIAHIRWPSSRALWLVLWASILLPTGCSKVATETEITDDSVLGSEDYTLQRSIDAHEDCVWALDISRDKSLMISSGKESRDRDTMKVWEADRGKLKFLVRDDAWGRVLAFSEDGRAFASGDADGSVHVWDSRTGKEILCGNGESARDGDNKGDIIALSVSADGQSLAWSRSRIGAVGFIDLKSGKRKQLYQAPEFRSPGWTEGFVASWLHMTRDTKLVICGVAGMQGKVVFLDTAGEQKVAAELPIGNPSAMAVDEEEKVLAIGAGAPPYAPVGIMLIDLKTRGEIKTITKSSGESFGYNRLRFVDGGKAIIASLLRRKEPHRVWQVGVWRISDGKELALFRWQDDTMRYFAFSGDGKVVATGHDDGKVKLWELPWSY
jgi:WD40 repeat protein